MVEKVLFPHRDKSVEGCTRASIAACTGVMRLKRSAELEELAGFLKCLPRSSVSRSGSRPYEWPARARAERAPSSRKLFCLQP